MKILQYTGSGISFDRKTGLYVINFNGDVYQQRICEFLYTFNILSQKDPEIYLLNTDSSFDTVKVPMAGRKGKTVSLTIQDFLALRNIYMEEMYLLKLEDLLFRSRISPFDPIFV